MGTSRVLPGFTAESTLGLTSRSYGYLGGHHTYIPKGVQAMELEQSAEQPTGVTPTPAAVPSTPGHSARNHLAAGGHGNMRHLRKSTWV